MIAKIVDGSDTERLLLHLVTTGDQPVLIAHSRAKWLVDSWYCTLTLHPDEPAAQRATWRAIAVDLMVEMGFSGNPAEPDYAWVAVHNGRAANGSDRLHIVANVVREDGCKWNRWRDQRRVQHACNTLEHKHGLRVLESREQALRGEA